MATAEQYAQWIVDNQDKKGTPEFDTVAQAYRLSKSPAADPNAKYKAKSQPVPVDPTADMNFAQTTLAGLGKMMTDTGRGVKQILGMGGPELQQTIDNEAELTKPLMSTVGGNVGNIGGNVGLAMLPGGALMRAGQAASKVPAFTQAAPALTAAGRTLLAPPSTMTGLGIGAAQGAAQGALQAVPTGDSRLVNSAMGATGGALLPAAGMTFGAAKGAFQPLYEGGRQQIVGDALRRATGERTDDVIANLRNASPLVPGSLPTAAEVGQSGGLAAMQRAASAVDPESYALRSSQNNIARVSELEDLAGTAGQRQFFADSRDATANQLYKQAYDKGIDITRDPVTGQFLPKAEVSGVKGEITKLLQRPSIQEAVKQARKLAADEGINLKNPSGSVQGLDYVKRSLDDMIKKTEGNEARVLRNLKGRLLTTLDRISPDYASARTTFADMSKPITQMDIAQHIADKSIRPLDRTIIPNTFAKLLSDDTAQSVTGMRNATLGNTIDPQQLGRMTNIRDDLARSVAAQNLGRGAGSDTVQKLSMTNLMQQSGLPMWVMGMPGVGRAGNFAYSQADDQMKQELARILLDPAKTAEVMALAGPNPTVQKLIEASRRIAYPGLLGLSTSNVLQQ